MSPAGTTGGSAPWKTPTSFGYEEDGGVAVLTLNRPDRMNAMLTPMMRDLLEAVTRLAADPEIGVVVLTGAGRAFCAGGDVKAMAEGKEFADDSLEAKAQALRGAMEISRLLHEMPKPTIAMVGGAAAGAGLSLALACDLRIAGTEAKFTTAFARVGYSGDFGGSYFLGQLVGTAKARWLYYTAALLDAEQALALGLVNRVVPVADLEPTVREVCAAIVDNAPLSIVANKATIDEVVKDVGARDLARSEELGRICFDSADYTEGRRAFMEKRKPVWSGK